MEIRGRFRCQRNIRQVRRETGRRTRPKVGSQGRPSPGGTNRMAAITLDNVDKVYENGFHAVHDLSLHIDDGEFLVLVGPSGCGKSTALRMIAGLETISSGRLLIDDADVTALEPDDRDIAMVFQSYALYPHLTVAREHRVRAQAAQDAQGRDRTARHRGRTDSRTDQRTRPQARSTVGRSAPACCHGPRHRPPAQSLPDGRATLEPRRQTARADACRGVTAAAHR